VDKATGESRARAIALDGGEKTFVKIIRGPLEEYLNGRRLVQVKIRKSEGRNVEGFLKIDAGGGERILVDFKATKSPQGGLSSLDVGGRKIPLVLGPAAKRS
jgi:hypothetical protein